MLLALGLAAPGRAAAPAAAGLGSALGGTLPAPSPGPDAASPAPGSTDSAPAPPDARPNVVFVLADDLSNDLLRFMPGVRALRRDGATLLRHVVTNSLCCPSRATILTGLLPHSSGIFRNTGADGGYTAFRERGLEARTFAPSIEAAGYRTALMGKYLNRYDPTRDDPPPGWTRWVGGGNGYRGFDYALNVDGQVVRHGSRPADYVTDVLAEEGDRFVTSSVQAGRPFLLTVSTYAPHAPFVPAPRDRHRFPRARAPRGPAFGVENRDAPRWLRDLPRLTARNVHTIDRKFRRRARAVQAVDRLLQRLRARLADLGVADRTYVVFTSDNGLHMGQHRLLSGKTTPFDSDIRVPMVVAGPGIAPGSAVDALTSHVDLAPTFAAMTGVGVTAPRTDGRSLLPVLRGRAPRDWRDAAVVEHRGGGGTAGDPDAQPPRAGAPPSYRALRTATTTYVEYDTGERELYGLARDPHQTRNVYGELSQRRRQQLHRRLRALRTCSGPACARGPRAPARRLP
ncbi:sulfatase [Patulibacter brassicae]|uniref:Sulfatase n=1 Tax=Patulibacter brassicae TaxID=1705717 RepID=A0ABU4VK98_9ACTN|nr:sulfatase [Patulibacter brassicae]MDX8152257.1 sulfatase [Patulibacter brassicae]